MHTLGASRIRGEGVQNRRATWQAPPPAPARTCARGNKHIDLTMHAPARVLQVGRIPVEWIVLGMLRCGGLSHRVRRYTSRPRRQAGRSSSLPIVPSAAAVSAAFAPPPLSTADASSCGSRDSASSCCSARPTSVSATVSSARGTPLPPPEPRDDPVVLPSLCIARRVDHPCNARIMLYRGVRTCFGRDGRLVLPSRCIARRTRVDWLSIAARLAAAASSPSSPAVAWLSAAAWVVREGRALLAIRMSSRARLRGIHGRYLFSRSK
eukprot:COSAG05_NODE_846_length_6998_cov_2.530077_2_plen_266_part_00